ncbi:MAG: ABC transporter permease subunit [Candidatus Krumholzibacteriota bacterium]
MPKPEDRRSITGKTWSRKPRRSVLLQDGIARRLITLSGIGGIVAVSMVGLFLLWVVLPLLLPTSLGDKRELPRVAEPGPGSGTPGPRVVVQAVDNYGSLSWNLMSNGTFLVQDLDTGSILDRVFVDEGRIPRSWAFAGPEGKCIFGFADGSVILAEVSFVTEFLDDDDVPVSFRDLEPGDRRVWKNGSLERTPEGQLRFQELSFTRDEALPLGEAPIELLDLSATSSGFALAALDSVGTFHYRTLTLKTNMLTGKVKVRSRGGELELDTESRRQPHDYQYLMLNDTGDLALLTAFDGYTVLLQKTGSVFGLTGTQDLSPEAGTSVTSMAFLTGKVSLAVGDSDGGLTVWFAIRGKGGDPARMVPAHQLDAGGAAVTALGASDRSRMLAAGYADGTVKVFHVTSHRGLGEVTLNEGPVLQVTLAPREDMLTAAGQGGAGVWKLDAPHADLSLGVLFRPVWYEGYPGPAYVWQSSAASDSFEPKLSLMPLIFGTLKATFYSLLFGLPLAVLAAIYTSEFLDKKSRSRVKPVIEIMASLPSVVLGFLAALVMAPLVEKVAVEILSVLVLSPFFVLLGAHLWQLLPRETAARLDYYRPLAVLAALILGGWVGWQMGPALENLGFAGDFKGWLDGRMGSGISGWLVLLLLPCGLFVGWLNGRYGQGFIRNRSLRWGRFPLGLLDLGRFLASAALAVTLALFLGWLLESSGWDPRGSVYGTYVQRNALVVGIAMGFAIIPLIYTISEDALTSVPDHLRAASLGAGATPWQTAVLVVIPPAMSGLFSAAMIGLGRAVGETMIVLMAAGNTPIMDMNIFNGFRTLSANLAVELPEAVQHSTHYRTLFLAALTLFAMTFLLNTVAEGVRLHFRRKTSRL